MQSLDDWRQHLQTNDVLIEAEVEWPPGGKSIYFRDPAGNSVELINRDVLSRHPPVPLPLLPL